MIRILLAATDAELTRYRTTLTGEKLGWLIYHSERCYAPVHQVLVDPENGPVIIANSEVLALEDTTTVYRTEEQAREAYWRQIQEAKAVVADAGVVR